MLAKKMGLSWITVSDREKAKKLFVDVLGMQLAGEAPEYNWMELKLGEGHLGVGSGCSPENGIKPGHNAVLTFTVDNAVEAQRVLKSNNVRVEEEIMEVPGHVKMVTFFDEDGNMFQLVEEINKSC
jgi:predicted enzyme related to lactoylglutathione lyase